MAEHDAKAHHPSASEFALVGSRDCIPDIFHGRHGHVRVNSFWPV